MEQGWDVSRSLGGRGVSPLYHSVGGRGTFYRSVLHLSGRRQRLADLGGQPTLDLGDFLRAGAKDPVALGDFSKSALTLSRVFFGS